MFERREALINHIRCNMNCKITLLFDIETLQYNILEGRKNPSNYKNVTFSVCVGWVEGSNIKKVLFKCFKDFFDTVIDACTWNGTMCTRKHPIILNAHNTNKYDNHFMIHDLVYYYNVKRKNMYLMNAQNNDNTLTINSLTKEDKEGIILEKRVKSGNNVECDFFLKGIRFKTEDNWIKCHSSIKMLGKKLLKKDLITKDELKTAFDYEKYNIDQDMSEDDAHLYAEWVFSQLTEKELIYIGNDVTILGKIWKYYSVIFKGFDYSKMTFTSNILEEYNTNGLSEFQLLNRYGKEKINYTDYTFSGENLYDYFKSFYAGGLNFYNQIYVNRLLVGKMFSMDINSSFPSIFHGELVPTFIKSFEEFETPTEINIKPVHGEFTLYRVDKNTFNLKVLARIKSRILKQILVKYYKKNKYVNINTNTIRILKDICKLDIETLPVISYVTFECVPFGSREKLEEHYFIKTQGKLKNKIIMKSPYDYEITNEPNTDLFTEEEIYIAKVFMNGLYGIPALRAFFNLFRLGENDELENLQNGYKNTERNIVFSTFVTSGALYKLLTPLKYLTHDEIDRYFIYCDTDSLYMYMDVYDKIPKHLFDDIALGKWGYQEKETEMITMFYVLNHKKYAYQVRGENYVETHVKSGGIEKLSFDTNMSFKQFVETQFHHGSEIQTTRSIYNNQGTISIYNSTTKIEAGKGYPVFFSERDDIEKQKLIEKIREDMENEEVDDFMYIESQFGTLSQADIYPYENVSRETSNIDILLINVTRIKNMIRRNGYEF